MLSLFEGSRRVTGCFGTDLAAGIRSKTLDEILNDWAGQIEQDVSTFLRQASLVAEWDKKVNENGDKVRRSSEDLSTTLVDP